MELVTMIVFSIAIFTTFLATYFLYLSRKDKDKKSLNRFVNIFIALGLFFLSLNIVIACINVLTKVDKKTLGFDVFGQIGDGFGGMLSAIFSLGGLYFVAMTISEQREQFNKTLTEQKEQFEIENKKSIFETQIPQLLKDIENVKKNTWQLNGIYDERSKYFFFDFYYNLYINFDPKAHSNDIYDQIISDPNKEWFKIVEIESLMNRYKAILLYANNNDIQKDFGKFILASLPFYFQFYSFCYFYDKNDTKILQIIKDYEIYNLYTGNLKQFNDAVIDYLSNRYEQLSIRWKEPPQCHK